MLNKFVQVRYQGMSDWQVKAEQRKVNFKVGEMRKLYSVDASCIKFGQNNCKQIESTVLFPRYDKCLWMSSMTKVKFIEI